MRTRGGRLLLLALLWCIAATVLTTTPARAADPGLIWPNRPTPSTEAATQECADVLFVGVRGSLEAAPYGGTVQAWRDAFAAHTASDRADGQGAARVREVALDYPATAPETILSAGLSRLLFDAELPRSDFTDSVAAGVAGLSAVLQDSADRCPAERWVIVGYSQGAQVVNETLAGDDAHDQLLAAVLLGNPGHYQGQRVIEESGTAGEQANGLMASLLYLRDAAATGGRDGGPGAAQAGGVRALLELGQNRASSEEMATAAGAGRLAVAAGDAERVHSICNDGDLVCDSGPALYRLLLSGGDTEAEIRRAAGPHGSYTPDNAPETVTAVVSELVQIRPPIPGLPPEVVPPRADERIGLLAGWVGLAAVLVLAGVVIAVVVRRRRARRGTGD